MKTKKKPPPDLRLAAHIIASMMRNQSRFADLGAFYLAQATSKIERVMGEYIREYGRTLIADLRTAQWMSLDDDTVRQLVGWCNNLEVPTPVVERAIRLARAPFTSCSTWIEWRMGLMPMIPGGPNMAPNARCGVLIQAGGGADRAALRQWRADYLRAIGKDPADDKVEPAAFWSARFFAADPSDPDSFPISPICFVVSTDLPLDNVLPDAGVDEIDTIEKRGTLLFGLIRAQPEWKSKALNKFAFRVDHFWTAQQTSGGMSSEQMAEQLRLGVDRAAGFGGFVLLALALLDQAEITYVPRNKNSHRIVAGKLLPGHDHRIVRIPIEIKPKAIVRYLGAKLASLLRMREHTVRGHWQRYGKQGVWTWKDDFKRGDPTVGVVRHDYSLEPPDDEPPDDRPHA